MTEQFVHMFAVGVGGAKREFDGAVVAAEVTSGVEIPFDGMNARHFDHFIVEQARAFAGVGEAYSSRGSSGPCHQTTTE